MDLTYNFNTKLHPADEDSYRAWLEKNSADLGRNLAKDLYDYDLRGWWRKSGGADLTANAHLTDEFKKPNHPTFSTDSKYSGVDGAEGGTWGKQDGKWTFTPGKTNLEVHGPDELTDYFRKVEPDSKLILPNATGQ